MATLLYLVIPCYNEEQVLPVTAQRLRKKLEELTQRGVTDSRSRICFVDDGSKDRTWELIAELHEKDPVFSGIKLSRNRGHQNALLCGLMTLKDRAECIISMDADLQDDIDAIDGMLEKFAAGCDVVYGVRMDRKTDGALKRMTAEGYYRFLKRMGAEIVFNHADFRLLSRRALDALAEYGEVNLFLRGIVPMLGFRSDVVYYARAERFAGKSKYSPKKMLGLAWEGITSLSIRPIRIVTALGAMVTLAGLVLFLLLLIWLCIGHPRPDWGLIVASVWTVGGLQMVAVGVVGEYVGKTYLESKARPRYITECVLDDRTS